MVHINTTDIIYKFLDEQDYLNRKDILGIIFYGSSNYNTDTKDSDLDLLIITNDENKYKGVTYIDDKKIALSMLSSAKEAADMYLNSALTSSTPELRAIYSASLTQMVEGHTALTELSLNKGWINPYDTPIKQLTCSYNESINTINEK